ncbi:hypothetical protein NDU88_005649 [Pleurodeles waltl]|uniref:Uncharacterized protein n=1 Tax=Pleurodeles waltl TaxID=8319 RepID=A0AAV7SMF3_PLEWA|nr:hypothetical protein NDU88_005649 [Pleurodeles waltl]
MGHQILKLLRSRFATTIVQACLLDASGSAGGALPVEILMEAALSNNVTLELAVEGNIVTGDDKGMGREEGFESRIHCINISPSLNALESAKEKINLAGPTPGTDVKENCGQEGGRTPIKIGKPPNRNTPSASCSPENSDLKSDSGDNHLCSPATPSDTPPVISAEKPTLLTILQALQAQQEEAHQHFSQAKADNAAFQCSLMEIKSKIFSLYTEVVELHQCISDLKDTGAAAGKTLDCHESNLVLLQLKVEDMENHLRRHNLRIFCKPEGEEDDDLRYYIV